MILPPNVNEIAWNEFTAKWSKRAEINMDLEVKEQNNNIL